MARTPAVVGPFMLALGAYRGALGRVVRAAKYTPDRALLRTLGSLLGARVKSQWPAHVGWCVVPVPGDPHRQRTRGLDHAQLLAEAVAESLGPRAQVERLLKRRRRTVAQSKLSHAERERNVRDAIVRTHPLPPGVHGYLLIDDVTTSGATLRACLVALGVSNCRVAVVAVGGQRVHPAKPTGS
jgi:competence protein ComFC